MKLTKFMFINNAEIGQIFIQKEDPRPITEYAFSEQLIRTSLLIQSENNAYHWTAVPHENKVNGFQTGFISRTETLTKIHGH